LLHQIKIKCSFDDVLATWFTRNWGALCLAYMLMTRWQQLASS
jgi:hypothetical protein